ncbi:flavoprotein [Streptosporangium sp. CA-135522]|uniref:flavoprotein n=1 Tax=Streptosporangium sp. CA-135522 TaxID=3240072 RepID=UPI003D8A01EE
MTNAIPRIELPRGRLLIVGTGAFEVIMLPHWVMLLQKWYGWSIRVCLTHAADELVSRQAIAAVTGTPVAGPKWPTELGGVPHQELAEWADLVFVFPATTNFVAKCALGIADSLALNTVINAEVPVVFAPAIPAAALRRPAVQRNLKTLEQEGYHVVPGQPGLEVHNRQEGVGLTSDIGGALLLTAKLLGPRPEGA